MGGDGMRKNTAPTTGANVQNRLFLRFFLLYGLAIPFGVLLYLRGARFLQPEAARWLVTLPTLLALAGALLTVSGPYLLLLSIFKGLADALLVSGATARVFHGEGSFLPYNGFLLLVLLSCLLYCYAASRACWFAFSTRTRDLRLLFSKPFAAFLLISLIMVALLSVIWFLWPHMT